MTYEEPRVALPSGRFVSWHRPHVPFAEHYLTLSWPRGGAEATAEDIDAMWSLAHARAREEGQRLFGDPQCFTVLYNGARTRRMPWPHFHIIPARTPSEKRWVLMCMSLKRISRRLEGAFPIIATFAQAKR